MQQTLAGVQRIVALSGFLARVFVENGFDADRIEVVPHGIEPGDLRPPEPSPGPTRLVFVGTIVPTKGLEVLIAAIRRVPELEVRLTIHGPAPAASQYVQSIIASAEGDERISFAGEFTPAAVGDVLATADFLVLPSLCYDNEPLAVKQAKHVGLPVIVSNVGSLADMVEEDVEGWTVPPGDEVAWGAAIVRAVEEHGRGRRWTAHPQPSMDDHYSRMESIYRELVPS
jgi:glycosyltransferase involved in cell wall biosynthesis